MDYPHGRYPHHGGDRREEEEEERYGFPPSGRPHPPPFYGGEEPSPHARPHPPPQVYHTSHMGPPGPESYHPPPPPAVTNHHPSPQPHHHPHMPHFPPAADHHSHHKEEELNNKPSFKMYSKAEPNYSLTIREGKVVLARADPSDRFQHWIKDVKLSTRVKDEEGFPSFALVNKATGQALKHAIGATHPVQLTQHNPNGLDESVLWTESNDLGDGYRAIRMVNNIRLNIDAFNGDKNHGGVRDGTKIVLWEWKKGDNQRWRICPL
ncbi:hypothetical protein PHJA_002268300 [Phtheirospermum japonicum]|uniref:Ricin B-like lectin R40G3 n=1 Tax=Phtheirospermum japonicum TaxID=374723 RepID=A0A830CZC6_9LAMI|nr:hypothetical protein PHJA_002268300 [Phtheirospermum japonicum]